MGHRAIGFHLVDGGGARVIGALGVGQGAAHHDPGGRHADGAAELGSGLGSGIGYFGGCGGGGVGVHPEEVGRSRVRFAVDVGQDGPDHGPVAAEGDGGPEVVACIGVGGVYEVLDYHDDQSYPNLVDSLGVFNDGYRCWQEGKWDQATKLFKDVKKINSGDKAAQLYLDRCAHMKKNPPKGDWNGVWVMTSK